ncbi:MAG: endonuclease/exonuclease/phosphatase family protein [Candidatus Melainabacteria bacterium]
MLANLIGSVVWLASAVASVLCVAGYFYTGHPLLDLASQFYWAYAVVLACGLLWMVYRVNTMGTILLALCLGLSLGKVVPTFLPLVTTGNAVALGEPIKILSFNTWASNVDAAAIEHLLVQEQPDLAALIEISKENRAKLEATDIFQRYPVHVRLPGSQLLLLSRFPLQGAPREFGDPPALQVPLRIQGKTVTLLVTHTTRPIAGFGHFSRHLANLAERVLALKTPVILLGDLNTGPWSRDFQSLLYKTGLINTQQGFGALPTYPVKIPRTHVDWPVPVLPIDHVLVSPDWRVQSRRVGSPAGSDHLPLILELGLQKL